MGTLSLPNELLVRILECLREDRDGTQSRRDFYNLSLSSRTLYQLSRPYLYHHIITDEVRLVPLIRIVIERPRLARLVKKLDVMGWSTPCNGPHTKHLRFLCHSHVPAAIYGQLFDNSLGWWQKNQLLLELLMAILQWVEWLLIPYFSEAYFRSIPGAGPVWPGPPVVFRYLKELICYNNKFTFDPSGFSTALLRMSQVKKLDIRTECIEFLCIPITPTRLEHLKHVVITCATRKLRNLSAFLQCCYDLEILEVSVRGLLTEIERFTSTLRVLKLYMNTADESFRQFEGLRELSVNHSMLTNSLSTDDEVIELVHDWTNKLPPSLERLHIDQWKKWCGPILKRLARQPPAYLPHLMAVTRGDELVLPPSPSSTTSSDLEPEEDEESEIMKMTIRMLPFSEDGCGWW